MSITITINAATAKEAVWELQMLANALIEVAPATPRVDAPDTLGHSHSAPPVELASTPDVTLPAIEETALAPVKRRGRPPKASTVAAEQEAEHASPAEPPVPPLPEPEVEVPAPVPPGGAEELKAIIDRLSSLSVSNLDIRAKVATWRDGRGVKWLRDLSIDHLADLRVLHEEMEKLA